MGRDTSNSRPQTVQRKSYSAMTVPLHPTQ
jgi:hypothetical protein